MAGNKVNTKTKGKDDKSKAIKGVSQTNEDSEDLDFAVLRKPVPTSITGFAQARKIFDLATEELKDILSNECDLLYECKVCRNIFRSLANFISHKRVYCKDKFSSSIHSHFVQATSTASEILKIKQAEIGYQESLKAKKENELVEMQMDDDRVPLTRDLTGIIENITKTKGVYKTNEDLQVELQKIPSSSVAMFQNLNYNEEKQNDKMRAQMKELHHIFSRDKAVLQSDGKFTVVSSVDSKRSADQDNVIQISDDEDNEDSHILKCKICDLQFSTQKTLKFHMKYKHHESRLVYPCPDCLEIFSTSWSVYRHLFKVHRKTAAQIRKLRESIQAKAFRMNNPPAYYEKRKNNMKPAPVQKITEEERLDQENQAWMDNMEGDGEVPRCGGCGRTFERRAALAAHTHTCQPRSRALARRPEAKKIEIQIRKDYNKGPAAISAVKAANPSETKPTKEEEEPQTTIIPTEESNKSTEEEKEPQADDDAPMDIEEDEKSNDSTESPVKIEKIAMQVEEKPPIRLPHALQAEKSNLAAFKQRIQADVEFVKHVCKKCDLEHGSVLKLYEHMAEHFKWMRYACKLCNFKHYNFDKLPEHVKVVHKLKGDSDFYFSTLKAIDGTEAMIISRCLVESETTEEVTEVNETSPNSRRPSRCSSDSSRLSDDSSSSSTVKEIGSRKRKVYHNKGNAKKKKTIPNDDGDDQKEGDITIDKVMKVILGDNNNSSNIKTIEENSSDMDDIEEKISKRHSIEQIPTMLSRRPIRKKTKPKNEDFEYDLSNLLKMEAQGYRDSQTVSYTKSTQTKKKVPPENLNSYEIINKDCCGALVIMSKKAVDKSAALMKTASFAICVSQKERLSNVFVKPMLPKVISRSDKMSPKKDVLEDSKDNSSPNKSSKSSDQTPTLEQDNIDVKTSIKNEPITISKPKDVAKTALLDEIQVNNANDNNCSANEQDSSEKNATSNKLKTNINIPAVVPIKFRRQSLDLMKNPIINKNITDFTKAGMKTKILVIKPINRNKDGTRTVSATPLKFQTIKLKDSNKGTSSNVDQQSDQVMVVKVPKVPCTTVSEKTTPTNTVTINNTSDIENTEEKQEENDTSHTEIKSNNKEEKSNEIECNEIETVSANANSVCVSDISNIMESVSNADKSEHVEVTA